MAAPRRIVLGDLLENVTSELRAANERALAAGNAVMKFKECELELAIEAENQGKAGIKFWVLNVGGSLKRTESNTIKIKYTAIGDTVAETEQTEGPTSAPHRRGIPPAKE
jgi:hypothetical protein